MSAMNASAKLIWRLRKAGLDPSSLVSYETPELEELCAEWGELCKRMEEIDRVIWQLAGSPEPDNSNYQGE